MVGSTLASYLTTCRTARLKSEILGPRNLWIMKDFGQPAYAKTPEQRRSRYSPVADAYDRARPRYPEEIIARAVELAGLFHVAQPLP